MKRSLVASVALVAALGTPSASIVAQRRNPAAQRRTPVADTTRWHFDVTPYLWASGIRGDVGVRDLSARVDLSFDKIIRHMNGAFMLPFEARRNRFGVGAEVIYTKISDDRARAGVLFTGADASASTLIGTVGARLRVVSTKKLKVDVLSDVRAWRLRNEVNLHLANRSDISTSLTKNWWDVVGGARGFYNVNDRWELQLRGDFGGFRARYTWQAIGGVGYVASSRVTVRAGYRELDVRFHDADDNFLYDVSLGGPILGATIRF